MRVTPLVETAREGCVVGAGATVSNVRGVYRDPDGCGDVERDMIFAQ